MTELVSEAAARRASRRFPLGTGGWQLLTKLILVLILTVAIVELFDREGWGVVYELILLAITIPILISVAWIYPTLRRLGHDLLVSAIRVEDGSVEIGDRSISFKEIVRIVHRSPLEIIGIVLRDEALFVASPKAALTAADLAMLVGCDSAAVDFPVHARFSEIAGHLLAGRNYLPVPGLEQE